MAATMAASTTTMRAMRPHTPDTSSTSPPSKAFDWRQIIETNNINNTSATDASSLPSPPRETTEPGYDGSISPPTNNNNNPSTSSSSSRSHLSVRERNRIAAHKCRAKSKVVQQELQDRERFLHEQNRYLTAQVHLLKGEVFDLKSAILRHGANGCENITAYMPSASGTNAAATTRGGPGSSSAPFQGRD